MGGDWEVETLVAESTSKTTKEKDLAVTFTGNPLLEQHTYEYRRGVYMITLGVQRKHLNWAEKYTSVSVCILLRKN